MVVDRVELADILLLELRPGHAGSTDSLLARVSFSGDQLPPDHRR